MFDSINHISEKILMKRKTLRYLAQFTIFVLLSLIPFIVVESAPPEETSVLRNLDHESDAQPMAMADSISPVKFQLLVDGLVYPVEIKFAGDGTGRMFIVQQTGQVLIYDGTGLLPTPAVKGGF